MKIFPQIAFGHTWQSYRVNEYQTKYQILHLFTYRLQFTRWNLSSSLKSLVSLSVFPIKFVKFMRRMCKSFHGKPSLHLSLSIINKKSSKQNPYHECHKRYFNHLFQICRMEHMYIYNIAYRKHKDNLHPLPQKLLKWVTECLMKSKPWVIGHFSIILINSKALHEYLDYYEGHKDASLTT